MSDSWARRWADSRLATAATCALIFFLTAACGGGATPPPQTVPASPVPGPPSAELATVNAEAEAYFEAGEESFRSGDYASADWYFQNALDVYLQAELATADRAAGQEAFNDLFNRIHALSMESLVPADDELVSLATEELPPPNEEDLADLRTRLAVAPEELPKFSMPVPSPRENERVEWALAYLTGDRRAVIEEGLSRATRFMPMIERIFDEEGVPRELAWVPLIESLFKTGAYSRAAAVGLWQFVSGTARLQGMKVDYNIDERKDPVRSTREAARYMKELYDRYDDWALVLAAYNAGWGRINRALQRAGVDDFWSLARTRYIPRETRDHVPKVYAAMLLGTDPDLYGLTVIQQEPYEFDESIMDAQTSLTLIADTAGTSDEVIQELNPHIRGWVPKGYPVRVPRGTKADFEAAIALIPAGERIEFLTHVVRTGDTLSEIAGQYGTRINAIAEANQMRNRNRLSVGQRLIIPVGPEVRPYRSQPVAGFDTGERTTYRVERGDSLYLIAQNFRTTVPNLMRWNDLDSGRIYPGDSLIIYYGVRGNMATPAAVSPAPAASAASPAADANADRGVYTVRPGDSLYEIAQRFDTSVDQVKRWNNRRTNTIHPGDKLVIYSPLLADGGGGGAGNISVASYTVRRGDSPYEIAQRHGVDLDALLAANGLGRRSSIYPGDELLIPGGGASSGRSVRYTVRRGDTLGTIAQRHGVSLRQLLQANSLSSRSVIHPGDTLTIPQR